MHESDDLFGDTSSLHFGDLVLLVMAENGETLFADAELDDRLFAQAQPRPPIRRISYSRARVAVSLVACMQSLFDPTSPPHNLRECVFMIRSPTPPHTVPLNDDECRRHKAAFLHAHVHPPRFKRRRTMSAHTCTNAFRRKHAFDCSTKQQFKARRKIALSSTNKREREMAAIKEQQASAAAAAAHITDSPSKPAGLSREQSAFMGDSSEFLRNSVGSREGSPVTTPMNLETSLNGSLGLNTSLRTSHHALSTSQLRDSRGPAHALLARPTAVRHARAADGEAHLSDEQFSAEAKAFLEMQHALDLEVFVCVRARARARAEACVCACARAHV